MDKEVKDEFERSNLNFKTLSSDIVAINKILSEHSEAIKKLQKSAPGIVEKPLTEIPPSGGLLE